MRNKSRIGKGKIQRQENKRERREVGEGREGQSLEVMGIGRNSVGNPWRQTH